MRQSPARAAKTRAIVRGGDLGFATEDELKQNGFPPPLVEQFFGAMQVGSYTAPVQFPNKRWYIFKLQSKQLQNENLTLDSPGVRQQITQALTDQRKQILNAALLEVAMNEAKVINNLASNMLAKPEMMSGMRQATPGTAGSPAASPGCVPQRHRQQPARQRAPRRLAARRLWLTPASRRVVSRNKQEQ